MQRIYVVEKLKGQKIGNELMEKCRDVAREKDYVTLWLGVWDQNIPAQRFYERLGMAKIGTTGFTDGKADFVNLVYSVDL